MIVKEKNKNLLSIVTPFFNTEMFIKESIESVLNQTYKNWELILIDDGSTDGSTDIAKHYASLYPDKIMYLEHENHQNLGASASRNLGIKYSKGKYIAFLDSDDVYLPTKLEAQVPLLDQQPEAAMLYSSTEYWYSWTGLPEDSNKDWVWNDFGVQPDTLIEPPKLLATFLKNGATAPCMGSVLARREAINNMGGWENAFRYIYTDQVFLAKMCLNYPVYVSSGCWDRYRQHPNSSCEMVKKSKQEIASKLNYLRWLEKYLVENEAKMNKELQVVFKNVKRINRFPSLYHLFKKYNVFKERFKRTIKLVMRNMQGFYNRVKLQHLRIGRADFGNLRRLTPISRKFGYDRGLPVDRFYIERFLESNSCDIKGNVLEVGDASYTRKFGGDKVAKSDVLHVVEGNPEATIIGDLTNADHIPSNSFDCIILTQTLHLIYDLKRAAETLYRLLKPGAVLLLTVPGISQVVKCNWGDNWYWAFTSQSAQLLFEEPFGQTNVQVENHGNVLAAIAFLHGIAVEELTEEELIYHDDEYQVIITVRAIKKVADNLNNEL